MHVQAGTILVLGEDIRQAAVIRRPGHVGERPKTALVNLSSRLMCWEQRSDCTQAAAELGDAALTKLRWLRSYGVLRTDWRMHDLVGIKEWACV
jgi:hypothetical protein